MSPSALSRPPAIVAEGVTKIYAGSRPDAGAVEWLAAAGVLALVTLALNWLSVALGLASKSVETASNLPTPLILLPFLGSGFVPTGSMPTGVRLFARRPRR